MKAVKGLGRSAASQKSLCSIKKTRTHSEKTDVSFLKKLSVSRNELRVENIDARNLDVLIAIFLLQVQKKDRRRTIRAHIPEVFCFKLPCKCIFCSALYFDEDSGCAARFATAIKFAFGSNICYLLFLFQ